VHRGAASLRFRPGGAERDARGRAWTVEGDRAALDLPADGPLDGGAYPNALERVWSLLRCVNAGEVVASAAPGWEFRDAGGRSHVGGGSHGSLHESDSLVPLHAVGLEPPLPARPTICDVAPLVRAHLRIGEREPAPALSGISAASG
jgi:hypothetical protein